MKRKLFVTFLLCALSALTLVGCGMLRKPEKHSMVNISIDSITTVCGTDCDISDIFFETNDGYGTATYVYTNVANDGGIRDAKTYYDYLKNNEHCVDIDEFDESAGSYNAYIDVGSETGQGFRVNVTFAKDTYTVEIRDNVPLSDKEAA